MIPHRDLEDCSSIPNIPLLLLLDGIHSDRSGTVHEKPSPLAIMSMHKKTRVNILEAHKKEGANEWLNNYRPSGLKSLVFDFKVNFTDSPSTYLDAAITNLFYLNNIVHDLFCK